MAKQKATLTLSRCTLLGGRGATRLLGYGVLAAVAYDGTDGVMPVVTLPPIRFRRRAQEHFDFVTASGGVGDDGVLLRTFDKAPPALAWAVTLTLTDTRRQASRVVAAALQAGGDAGGSNFAARAARASAGLVSAIGDVTGARVVGTWIGAEVDDEDLDGDWELQATNFKTRFELSYQVRHRGRRRR